MKSKPEVNNQVGKVGSFVEASGRYVVSLPQGVTIALKPANLEVMESLVQQEVRVAGLKSKPELNGQIGKVTSFTVDSGRYVVSFKGDVVLALKRDNLTVITDEEKAEIEAAAVAERRKQKEEMDEERRKQMEQRQAAKREAKKAQTQQEEAERKQQKQRKAEQQALAAQMFAMSLEEEGEGCADAEDGGGGGGEVCTNASLTENQKGDYANDAEFSAINGPKTKSFRLQKQRLGFGAKKRIKP